MQASSEPSAVDTRLNSGSDTFEFLPDEKAILLDGRHIKMSAYQLKALEYLASRPGVIISREELSLQVRSKHDNSSARNIDGIIKALRAKLSDDYKNPRWIETIQGIGYRFLGR